ncbi:MAG: hypothetical protein P8Y03_04485 [Anaerolineales bacterium]
MKNRAILAWSGGKDSALALYEMTRQDRTQVVALLTTVTEGYDRISMHGVRRELLAEQAKALGYPLEEVRLPQQCTNELYEQRMGQALDRAFAGRDYDEDLLKDLPPEVDPCGENGEFHTFVYAGPLFHRPVRIERGEKILRENRFYYCDLVAGQLSR